MLLHIDKENLIIVEQRQTGKEIPKELKVEFPGKINKP